jgi:hypothetical protein
MRQTTSKGERIVNMRNLLTSKLGSGWIDPEIFGRHDGKEPCPLCGKLLKGVQGVEDHTKDVHPAEQESKLLTETHFPDLDENLAKLSITL